MEKHDQMLGMGFPTASVHFAVLTSGSALSKINVHRLKKKIFCPKLVKLDLLPVELVFVLPHPCAFETASTPTVPINHETRMFHEKLSTF